MISTKDFVYRLLENNKQLVKSDPQPQFQPKIAVLSSLLDFPCNFRPSAGPKSARCDGSRRSPKCCCKCCAERIGHFGEIWPSNLAKLGKYAKKFTKINGFWRAGKGCILPRHMRSLVCAFFMCGQIQKEFNERNDSDLIELRAAVAQYNSRDYLYGGRHGPYAKRIKEIEDDLNTVVEKVKRNRKLYYDPFKEKLISIVERKVTERHGNKQLDLTLEDGRKVTLETINTHEGE